MSWRKVNSLCGCTHVCTEVVCIFPEQHPSSLLLLTEQQNEEKSHTQGFVCVLYFSLCSD